MQEDRNTIQNFIQKFSCYGKPVTQMFTEGQCFWFATILKERFPEAEIFFLPTECHFVTKINDRYWDITGNVTGKYQDSRKMSWKKISEEDPKRTKKIVKEFFV